MADKPSEIWSATIGGVKKTCAEWGLSSLKRSLRSQACDELVFTQTLESETATVLCGDGDTVIVWRKNSAGTDIQWFVGEVKGHPREIAGATNKLSYVVLGPWIHLETLPCAQSQKVWDEATGAEKTKWTTHIYLGVHGVYNETTQTWDMVRHSTRSQIEEILAYVNNCHASPVIGIAENEYPTVRDPGTNIEVPVPIDEVVDLTCAQAVKRQLSHFHDCVTRFDYSQTPPVLHITRRADMPAIQMPAAKPVEVVRIEPRYDLLKKGVVVKYEQTNVVNDAQRTEQFEDCYPATIGSPAKPPDVNIPGVFGCTVVLAGMSATVVTGTTIAIPHHFMSANAVDRVAWWKQRVPWLAKSNVNNLVISEGTLVPEITGQTVPNPTVLCNELIGGAVASWMGRTAVKTNVMATISYMLNTGTVKTETITTKVTLTNAIEGTQPYSALNTLVQGDDAPVGLAKVYYDALKKLQYSGQIILHEQEVGDLITTGLMGKVLNLTGSRTEWATMDAMVQAIEEDVDSGTTTINIGPADHLGIQDLIQLLKGNRQRTQWSNPATQYDSTLVPGSVTLPTQGPMQDTTRGAAAHQSFACEKAGYAGYVRMDMGYNSGANTCTPFFQMTTDPLDETRLFRMDCADMVDSLGRFHPMKIREIPICVGSTQMYFLGPASAFYTKP